MNSGDAVRFEVVLNGTRKCIAGVENFGVMNVIVDFVRHNPARFDSSNTTRSQEEFGKTDLRFIVGGLADRSGENPSISQFLHWSWSEMKAGDQLLIRVLPPGEFDPPVVEEVANGPQNAGPNS